MPEVSDLDEPASHQRFEAIIYGSKTDAHPLAEFPLRQRGVLVQQPKDLKICFVLDFGLGVQVRYRSTGTGENPTALYVNAQRYRVFKIEQG